jgi:phytoene dehydrogenase-like protein
MPQTSGRAVVVGSGPNGLSAAIVLARAGMQVEVFEAEPTIGGAARTLELTLPGFRNDFGSAVHPMAAASPFFKSLPLEKYGVEWVHSPSALAHPLDDGTAVLLHPELDKMVAELGEDGERWRKVFQPFASHWDDLATDVLRPVRPLPAHPLLMARFGVLALQPARALANRLFKGTRAKALFAGIAAHSVLSLDAPISAAFPMIFGSVTPLVGWPVARGGSQSISNALVACLRESGGKIHTGHRVQNLDELGAFDLAMCDVTPRQLLAIAGHRLSLGYRRSLEKYRYGLGVFKVDYALSSPVPWKARECAQAITVHLGGTLDEVADSESAGARGEHAERPFVLLAQPSLFDATRAPAGRHTLWAYCHVPNGSAFDMLPRIEAQIERFAPGFRDCVLERRIFSPAALEGMDANLIGGDIGGGAPDLRQFLFRPTWGYYATSARDIFLCSSSTPPGGGVHGMCGYNAAKLALKWLSRPA